MPYVDFEKLKEEVTIEQVVALLGLTMKQSNHQLRGACPVCGGGDRSLVVTPAKSAYFCFQDQKGGDLIALAAHVRQESVKDAAQFIQHALPQEKVAKETPQKLQPLSHLEFDHPAVEALGLDTAVAEALGIGYAPKGVAKGNVVIPIRDEQGTLKGYLGVQELTFIPRDFLPSNVVKLRA